jgi:hypothetical protein
MVLQGELQERSTSHNLMGDCNIDHMLDASRRGHVRRHVLLDLVETRKKHRRWPKHDTGARGSGKL